MLIIANLSIDSFAFLLKSLGVVSTVFCPWIIANLSIDSQNFGLIN